MSGTAAGNLRDGAGTFVIGLVLWLFTDGVEVPVVTLTKVGAVMMCVGGVLLATGLCRWARGTGGS